MDIILIHANKCPKCKSMIQAINSISKALEISDKISLKLYEVDDDEATDMAIDYEIDDVPGCNINGKVIQGENFKIKDIEDALKSIKS